MGHLYCGESHSALDLEKGFIFFALLCCQEAAREVFDEHVSSRQETLEHCLFGSKMKCSGRKSSCGEKKKNGRFLF